MIRRDLQRRTLIRTPDLHAFRGVLTDLALEAPPLAARRRVVIVPTRASAELLRQAIERRLLASSTAAIVVPDVLTRDEWVGRLHEVLPDAPPLVGRLARERLIERAARRAAHRARQAGPPFPLRPGLVAEMLRFYDELRLRQRTVRRFTRALFDELRVERGTDRGSEDLIRQTIFLGFTFLGYERDVAAAGAIDEHGLRARLIAQQPRLPFDHLVVAVADRPTDPRGLWPADFDLIGRLTACARIDVVMTDEAHDAGFRERIERELPGIEDVRHGAPSPAPALVRPDDAGSPCFVSRDREEEVRDVARAIRGRASLDAGVVADTAIVCQRPLPYVYLASQVLADAGIPSRVFDGRPLASEPWAAWLDQALTVARTGGTRESVVSLLRSPLARFGADGVPVTPADVASLDAALGARRATGDATTYAHEVDAWFGGRPSQDRIDATRARRAAKAAGIIGESLRPFRDGDRASRQIAAVSEAVRRWTTDATDVKDALPAEVPATSRSRRARAAVLAVLDELGDAFARFDDEPRDADALTALVHHAIEARTFATSGADPGVLVVDAVSARFADVDHVHVVGLVETDWPERTRRSILYTSPLLASLGWPQETDRARGELAAFRDLMHLARRTVQLHAFQLEGDAVIALSPLVAVAATGLATASIDWPVRRIFSDEVLTSVTTPPAGLDASRAEWLRVRLVRPPLSDLRFAGRVDAQPPRAYRVSAVDRYVECPFKYFSEAVLGLPEERDEAAGLTPLERGTLVHELFERFYREWQARGEGTITPGSLPRAIELFGRLTREALAPLPAPDRVLEETRLLGSIVARGVAERVFEHEAEVGGRVVDRLLEFELRGPFVFPRHAGFEQTTIAIRGKADRIDVFDDGTIRVIDYKLGRMPDLDASVQVAVYAHCARQALEKHDGLARRVSGAAYIAFGDDLRVEGSIAPSQTSIDVAVTTRASSFADSVAAIETGEFPARPRRVDLCQWCRYAGVCRKEYRVEHDAAESV